MVQLDRELNIGMCAHEVAERGGEAHPPDVFNAAKLDGNIIGVALHSGLHGVVLGQKVLHMGIKSLSGFRQLEGELCPVKQL